MGMGRSREREKVKVERDEAIKLEESSPIFIFTYLLRPREDKHLFQFRDYGILNLIPCSSTTYVERRLMQGLSPIYRVLA
jgi:hypothetical protein